MSEHTVLNLKTATQTQVIPYLYGVDVKTGLTEPGLAIIVKGKLVDDTEAELYWVISQEDSIHFIRQIARGLGDLVSIPKGNPCERN